MQKLNPQWFVRWTCSVRLQCRLQFAWFRGRFGALRLSGDADRALSASSCGKTRNVFAIYSELRNVGFLLDSLASNQMFAQSFECCEKWIKCLRKSRKLPPPAFRSQLVIRIRRAFVLLPLSVSQLWTPYVILFNYSFRRFALEAFLRFDNGKWLMPYDKVQLNDNTLRMQLIGYLLMCACVYICIAMFVDCWLETSLDGTHDCACVAFNCVLGIAVIFRCSFDVVGFDL